MEKHFTHAAFKRKVILCTEKVGDRAAGREYTVNEAWTRHLRSIKTIESLFWTKEMETS
jgi:hypothetical protein